MFTIISWNYYAREIFQDSYQSFVDDFGNWQSLGALFSVMGGLCIDLLSPYMKRNTILESKLICACIIIIVDNCVGIGEYMGRVPIGCGTRNLAVRIFQVHDQFSKTRF